MLRLEKRKEERTIIIIHPLIFFILSIPIAVWLFVPVPRLLATIMSVYNGVFMVLWFLGIMRPDLE